MEGPSEIVLKQEAFNRFRGAFDRDDGRYTLATILQMGGFWTRCDTEEERIRRNFCVDILEVMGITNFSNDSELTKLIADMPTTFGGGLNVRRSADI